MNLLNGKKIINNFFSDELNAAATIILVCALFFLFMIYLIFGNNNI